MPETEERLADVCDQIFDRISDLEPAEMLTVLLAVAASIVIENDTPGPCLDYACEVLAAFVHDFDKAGKLKRSHLRLVPKENA